ncbi:MAG: hypothetical protein ACK5Z1_08115 [Gemmatimonadota bacterium]
MNPYENRRLLLSEDDEKCVWLDLDTGQEVVEPSEAGDELLPASIESAILAWFQSLGVTPRRTPNGSFVIGFWRTIFDGRVLLEFDEEKRALHCMVNLGLKVPDARRADVALALLELHTFGDPRVSLFGDRLYTEQFGWLGDASPTADFIGEQSDMVMYDAEVLHLVLANVIAGLCPPTQALELARKAKQKLAANVKSAAKQAPDDAAGDTA